MFYLAFAVLLGLASLMVDIATVHGKALNVIRTGGVRPVATTTGIRQGQASQQHQQFYQCHRHRSRPNWQNSIR